MAGDPQQLVKDGRAFLLELANKTRNGVCTYTWSRWVGNTLRYDNNKTDSIVTYLKGLNFIDASPPGFHFRHKNGDLISLTSDGITYLSNNLQGTGNQGNIFVTNNIGNMFNSQLQQFSGGAQQASQSPSVYIYEFITGLRKILADNKIQDRNLEDDISRLEIEIKADPSNMGKIMGWMSIILQKLPLIVSSLEVLEKIKELASPLFLPS